MCNLVQSSSIILYLSLYYKERRQLKIFLTQFWSALPLPLDPPVRLHDDQKGGTTIKIAIWGAFLQNVIFLSPTACILAHQYPSSPPTQPVCTRVMPSPVAFRCHVVLRSHESVSTSRHRGGRPTRGGWPAQGDEDRCNEGEEVGTALEQRWTPPQICPSLGPHAAARSPTVGSGRGEQRSAPGTPANGEREGPSGEGT
jgi:hypothetical protein